jgi:hypothetical protein
MIIYMDENEILDYAAGKIVLKFIQVYINDFSRMNLIIIKKEISILAE